MPGRDDWRGSYDAWKTRTPPEYEVDDPPPEQEPGECRRCKGSGWIVVNALGRYLGAGPIPDYSAARGLHDTACDACDGSGFITEWDE